jgi:DNA polymerase-3 subunit gamma/tau
MSYLVLARKYRPSSFDSVSGQEHVVKTLQHAIERDKVAHAYLFCGPRGVGKTSIARIFAKALNMEGGPSISIAEDSANAKEIDQGSSLAVREIDGASHNSVDNVRDLIDSFRSAPPPGWRYKIYIIDEVHMLSNAAFNALLKSLEEPPSNTVFILATTEPHKIPETVISRCQRHDFRALSVDTVRDRLSEISAAEDIECEDAVLRLISRLSEGSMRDAQSLLDRVFAFAESPVSLEQACEALGVVSRSVLFRMSEAVFGRDPGKVMELLQMALSEGTDITLFLKEVSSHWRELMLAKFGGAKVLLEAGLSKPEVQELESLVSDIEGEDLQDLSYLLREGVDVAHRSSYPRMALEALLVRLSTREPSVDIVSLLQQRGIETLGHVREETRPTKKEAGTHVEAASAKDERTPPLRKEAPKESLSRSSTSAPGENSSDDLSSERVAEWAKFVHAVGTKKKGMLAEYLKRVELVSFTDKLLKAKAPNYVFAYFQSEDHLANLKELLFEFFGIQSIHINFEATDSNEDAAGSLNASLKADRREKKKKIQSDVMRDPGIQALKKAFPGSEVKQISSKRR